MISLPLPLAYAYWRVGPESFDMSVADASLLAATIVALPYVPWRDRRLQRALWVVIAYELMLVVPLAANPTGPALFEWFHRALLVGGSVLVGAALVRLASLRFALRAFAAASAAISIVAIVFTLTNDLDPAYPLGLHKNAAGNILAIAVLMGLVTPQLLGLRRWMHVLLEAAADRRAAVGAVTRLDARDHRVPVPLGPPRTNPSAFDGRHDRAPDHRPGRRPCPS